MTRRHSPTIVSLVGLALLVAACTPSLNGLVTAGQSAQPAGGGPDVIGVAQKVKPATVLVQNLALVPADVARAIGTGEIPQGVGTGFIYDEAGYIVTNHHVIEGAERLRVVLPPPDHRQFDARLLGTDPQTDLAVLKIDGEKVPTVPLGASADLQVGQWVVAIGNALGLPGGPTVTAGVVSALDRDVPMPGSSPQVPGAVLYGLVQTDAAINQGNSGGPLVNLEGEVVGVNTLGSTEANAIGFAVAIDSAKPIIEQLRQNGRVARGYLGIGASSLNQAQATALGLSQTGGVLVMQVEPRSPAATAGMRPGDLLVQLGDVPVASRRDMELALSTRFKPGETVQARIIRDGTEQTVSVQLGERPGP